ncbi:MAG: UDP-glucose/GDP-mannose dehydrogenase family protein [Planctomycetota bacterium]
MNISVVGTGYVGLVAGACFADSGHRVLCVDCDEKKVQRLTQGEIPIFEPGLAEIVQRCQKAGRIAFTTDLAAGVKHGRLIFIAVGTPQGGDGSADLSAILNVADTVGKCMDGYRVVVMKSTVPVGTHMKVTEALKARTEHPFDYVSNPEFLKEGAAIEDFMRPDRVVIGTVNPAAAEIMRELYAPFMRRDERIMVMDPASAEMTKYAANAMLATRISFINEIACLCEKVGADVEAVRRGVGSDSRIGSAFLYAGVGYGGSCFPKDVSALVCLGKSAGQNLNIVNAVQEVNARQRQHFAERVIARFEAAASKTTLAVWGLAFKAWTDDVRESPAIAAVKMFVDRGIAVRAYDPEAMPNAAGELGANVRMVEDAYEALGGADALVIFTDWPQFRTPDFELISSKLRQRVIFDGRNLFDPKSLARLGFEYHCVGRPVVRPR